MKKIIFTAACIFASLSFFSCGGNTQPGTETPAVPQEIEIDATTRADAGGSGVMLQGFTWSSPHMDGDWWSTISNNASDIKDVFEYVWFPPVSDCTDTTGNGYLPRQLNMLTQANPDKIPYYGSEAELKQAIQDIKPAKAIADVVLNHRCGTTDWGDFSNPSWGVVKGTSYKAICSNDEGFSNKNSDMYGVRYKGASDTGESYSAGRDIDHTNTEVQNGIITWLNDVLKDAGFVGWRYDYVKGYAGNYPGYYNNKTSAAFSVGEYWPTSSFTASTWSNLICNWIKETAQITNSESGKASRAFDFVLKANLNSIYGSGVSASSEPGSGNGDYSVLKSDYNIYKKFPGYAVTFIDNHDTGSTQAHWFINPNGIAPSYAFILTHPGVPCVAWYHYFDAADCNTDVASQYIGGNTVPGTSVTYKEYIKELIALRSEVGITDMSDVKVIQADTTRYAAEITGNTGSAYVVLGTALDSTPEAYALVLEGTGFQVYKK
ncbi:MAG: hypothetical protein IIT58_12610 [Treponema sp.]|nr:hypothetical protein [Treponema sp.]